MNREPASTCGYCRRELWIRRVRGCGVKYISADLVLAVTDSVIDEVTVLQAPPPMKLIWLTLRYRASNFFTGSHTKCPSRGCVQKSLGTPMRLLFNQLSPR